MQLIKLGSDNSHPHYINDKQKNYSCVQFLSSTSLTRNTFEPTTKRMKLVNKQTSETKIVVFTLDKLNIVNLASQLSI